MMTRTGTLVRRGAAALALALGVAVGMSGCGADDDETSASERTDTVAMEIGNAWVRATEGADDPSMTGAFMTIDNPNDAEVALVGAESPVADMVQLHEMVMVEGSMVMREVAGGIPIAPGGGKLLAPGGYHVMLMGLTQQLAAGDEVDLTLHFSDGSSQEVTAPVKEYVEEEGHYHAPGSESHGHSSGQ
jgi:copper(I)-binding protein